MLGTAAELLGMHLKGVIVFWFSIISTKYDEQHEEERDEEEKKRKKKWL